MIRVQTVTVPRVSGKVRMSVFGKTLDNGYAGVVLVLPVILGKAYVIISWRKKEGRNDTINFTPGHHSKTLSSLSLP